ncbi:MAG: hypothetical protein LBC83_07340 [Oscillospiraceae bacterium]|nr:hypothetical protein [Oscillospiraceae bacterium]
MIRDIPKPEISPNFTIDDIHKLREWNYETLKDATVEEQVSYYRDGARRFDERMAALQAARLHSA